MYILATVNRWFRKPATVSKLRMGLFCSRPIGGGLPMHELGEIYVRYSELVDRRRAE
jgi:hypothetical protein